MSAYTKHGYKGRTDYLRCLADDYGVKFSTVLLLAETLGPNEDFDGLVNSVEDLVCYEYDEIDAPT